MSFYELPKAKITDGCDDNIADIIADHLEQFIIYVNESFDHEFGVEYRGYWELDGTHMVVINVSDLLVNDGDMIITVPVSMEIEITDLPHKRGPCKNRITVKAKLVHVREVDDNQYVAAYYCS